MRATRSYTVPDGWPARLWGTEEGMINEGMPARNDDWRMQAIPIC